MDDPTRRSIAERRAAALTKLKTKAPQAAKQQEASSYAQTSAPVNPPPQQSSSAKLAVETSVCPSCKPTTPDTPTEKLQDYRPAEGDVCRLVFIVSRKGAPPLAVSSSFTFPNETAKRLFEFFSKKGPDALLLKKQEVTSGSKPCEEAKSKQTPLEALLDELQHCGAGFVDGYGFNKSYMGGTIGKYLAETAPESVRVGFQTVTETKKYEELICSIETESGKIRNMDFVSEGQYTTVGFGWSWQPGGRGIPQTVVLVLPNETADRLFDFLMQGGPSIIDDIYYRFFPDCPNYQGTESQLEILKGHRYFKTPESKPQR